MLDRLKGVELIGPEIAPPYRRNHNRRRHRDAADPDHDGQHMQRAGGDDVIHDGSVLGPDRHPRTGSYFLMVRVNLPCSKPLRLRETLGQVPNHECPERAD